jgi:hypothetical protein
MSAVAAGYSKTPLAKKLGLHAGDRFVLLDAPAGWSVPEPPEGVEEARERGGESDVAAEVIVAFCATPAALERAVRTQSPRIFPAGGLWIAWPGRAGGHRSEVSENDIRATALPLGLVDVKVAALDEDWSGLRLVWRRKRR